MRSVLVNTWLALLGSLAAAAQPAAGPCRTEAAVALVEARKTAAAKLILEPCVREDPGSGPAAHYLGRAYLAERDEDRAITWMEKAVALDPKSSDYQLWLGRAYGQKARQANVFKQASLAGKVKKTFEKAVQLDPNNLEARSAVIDFYLIAPGIMGGSVGKAREQAAEIRKRDALKGHRAFGRIAEHEKHFGEAEQEYERAAREFPEKPEPYYWRAGLAVQQKNYAKAFEILESLLKTQPSESNVYYQIGRVAALSAERLERGEECLKLYLEHEPTKDEPPHSWAHYRLGAIYEKRGDKDLARNEYAAALRLDPSLKEAKEALTKLS